MGRREVNTRENWNWRVKLKCLFLRCLLFQHFLALRANGEPTQTEMVAKHPLFTFVPWPPCPKICSHRNVVSVSDRTCCILSHSVHLKYSYPGGRIKAQSCLNSFRILSAAGAVRTLVTAFANTGVNCFTQICQRASRKECPSTNWILMRPESRLGIELFHSKFQTRVIGTCGLFDVLTSPVRL